MLGLGVKASWDSSVLLKFVGIFLLMNIFPFIMLTWFENVGLYSAKNTRHLSIKYIEVCDAGFTNYWLPSIRIQNGKCT